MSGDHSIRHRIGLFLGPALFVLILALPVPEGMPAPAMRVGAVALLMAVWWITEALPIAATALLPIALFPFLGVMSAAEATRSYANHLIYLFLGGFLIAVTMEKWNLHKRIALHTIRIVGVSPNRIVLGFMLATAFLSMWISNTATTMMMLPIALAVVGHVGTMVSDQAQVDTRPGRFKLGVALMLGIAYSASIGGVATLIGTPPNAILAGVVEKLYGHTIGFAAWMSLGVPLALMMLAVAWFYLTRIAYPSEVATLPRGREIILDQLRALGPMSRQEKWVLAVFASVAAAWILRGFIDIPALAKVRDSSIAIAGALLLFVIPSNFRKGEFLLDWATAVRIPWDIIILFGGGFTLAHGFAESGLAQWIVQRLAVLEGAEVLLLVGAVAAVVLFLTEVTSNTATATLLLPIMGAFAAAVHMHPLGLMVPAAIATSYAFMMPVATPPNAIIFGSRYVSIPQMAKAGVWMNLIACGVVTLMAVYVLPWLWGLELEGTPASFGAAGQ